MCVFQKNIRLLAARRPQKKTIIQPASRGPIYDRFDTLLAQNRICYHAAIYYSQILQIPRIKWISDTSGKKIKTFPRKQHISQLARLLGKELNLNPDRIEDLIHAKASIFPHTPFIIQKNITEKTYYHLKLLEKDWLGLHAQISSERYYPYQALGSSFLGYLGTIQAEQYISIANELKSLKETLSAFEREEMIPETNHEYFETYKKYLALKEKAYSINDLVGKSGIEKIFEKQLRGFYGKTSYEIGSHKNFLREIPGCVEPTPGMKVKLSISYQLQQFAEKLLAQSEIEREGRSFGYDPNKGKKVPLKQPWIKGGTIIAMDPNNGEVLAFASYPRFNPNDFAKNQAHEVHKWLESEKYKARIWEGKEPLTRELFSSSKGFYHETKPLTLSRYLLEIFAEDSIVYQSFLKVRTLRQAIEIQENTEALMYFSKEQSLLTMFHNLRKNPQYYGKEALNAYQKLLPYLRKIPAIQDQICIIDLCRLFVYSPSFSNTCVQKLGHLPLSHYFELTQNILCISETLEKILQEYFELTLFPLWRKEHQKTYLAKMRKKEKEQKKYAKPYIDYLDRKRDQLFKEFWKKNRLEILTHFILQEPILTKELANFVFSQSKQLKKVQNPFQKLRTTFKTYGETVFCDFLHTIREYKDLNRPLYGKYPLLRSIKNPCEKDLAIAFYPKNGFGYLTPYTHKQACTLGSIFKIVTGYEALRQSYEKKEPFQFQMIDQVTFDRNIGSRGSTVVGYTLNHRPYPRYYRGGRLPRTASKNLGKIDLKTAIERTSNSYFSILAGDHLHDPEDLARAAQEFGFGQKTHIDLPGEYPGKLPKDLRSNRTGLYSFAIGQHSFVSTPLQTANFLCTLANYGARRKPQIVLEMSGKTPDFSQEFRFYPDQFTYQQELAQIGLFFPLFTQTENHFRFTSMMTPEKKIQNWVFLPKKIRKTLLDGMHRVVYGKKGTARFEAIRNLWGKPKIRRMFQSYKNQVVGKTATAQISALFDITPSEKPKTYTHVGFAGIGFEKTPPFKTQEWEKPEIVVIVYLQYADSGKEAAPIALQMIDQWRKIKYNNQQVVSEDKSASK